MASMQCQAEAEDLASKHARELQHLKDSLEEALLALSRARDEQVAAEMHHSGQARQLQQQHEQLAQRLQVQHKLEMQVRLAYMNGRDNNNNNTGSTIVTGASSSNHACPVFPLI